MPHTKISFSVFVNSLAILNHRKFGDSFSTEIQSLKFDLKIKARPPELRPHFLFFKVLVLTMLKPSRSILTDFHVSERIMKSKLLIIRKQSGSRNLLPNDFEESPLMFHAKKDNLLD